MIVLAYLLLIGIIIVVAWLAHRAEARIKIETAVSTFEDTDYVLPPVLARTGTAVVGFFIVILALLLVTGVWMGLGIAVVLVFGVLRYGLLVQYRAGAAVSSGTRASMAVQKPEFADARFAFFFSAPDLIIPDHFNMWRDDLDALGLPWCAVFKEQKHLVAARSTTHVPGIFVSRNTNLHAVLPIGAQLVFYANNGQQNRRMMAAYPDKKHIQLLHGDSDKPPSYSPLTKNYDYVFVAGQMAIDRYTRNGVDIPDARFRIVGRPQVKTIEPGAAEMSPDVPCIVYMPTWRGFHEDTQFSSLDRAALILETIMSGEATVRVVFKPHPMSYKDPDWKRFEKQINAALSKRRSNGSTGTFAATDAQPFDLYNQADIMVTDISSVLIDFLYSEKPIVLIEPPKFDRAQADNFPTLKASYVVGADLANLTEMLEVAMGTDLLSPVREEVKAYAFGDVGRVPGEAFREVCFDLLAGADERTGKGAL
ncbi:CDP-glycerol glycerophosphotransferase family protein [Ascidiaceihabitans sp.]|nr:CDP-glycerol glycerophosphotransferase family protein [Ascidiaceihabitans sp.]